MTDPVLQSYEEVPYESRPQYPTSPDVMATMATFYGLTPPPAQKCRVLELGCSTGGNLIPLAVALPDSRFRGIDLSPGQIQSGQAVITALGLANIELQALSIVEVDASFGMFDYIICHGVYSWVPAAVQDKILDICARHLTPHGIAYVSYNTYPGWHLSAILRNAMLLHDRRQAEAGERVRAAQTLLAFLARHVLEPDSDYARLLQNEVKDLLQESPSYLYHEYLEDENRPVYFREFVERAAAKGLQHVCDGRPSRWDVELPAEVGQTLDHWTDDFVRREQYLDFLRNRKFRRSLLCHSHHQLSRALSPELIGTMLISANAQPRSPQPAIHSASPETFDLGRGRTMTTNHPLLKTALVTLYDFRPAALPFGELHAQVLARLQAHAAGEPRAVDTAPAALAGPLWQCFHRRALYLQVHMPPVAAKPSDRPLASPLARFQAPSGTSLANLRHAQVEVTEFDRALLPFLDGTRDRTALCQTLAQLVADDRFAIHSHGQIVKEPSLVRQVLENWMAESLERLARSALLMG
jgi:methyltransferase-like protein/SAM-dependent methyltransferase